MPSAWQPKTPFYWLDGATEKGRRELQTYHAYSFIPLLQPDERITIYLCSQWSCTNFMPQKHLQNHDSTCSAWGRLCWNGRAWKKKETVDQLLDISERVVGVTGALEKEPKDVEGGLVGVWAGCQLRAQGVGDRGRGCCHISSWGRQWQRSDKTNGLSKEMRTNSSCVPRKEDSSSIKGRFVCRQKPGPSLSKSWLLTTAYPLSLSLCLSLSLSLSLSPYL